MCGFIAHLVEHCTGVAEVTGSNPVEALIFSGLLASLQLLKLKNLLRWSFFTLIYNLSTIWIISYILHMNKNFFTFSCIRRLMPPLLLGIWEVTEGLFGFDHSDEHQTVSIDSVETEVKADKKKSVEEWYHSHRWQRPTGQEQWQNPKER